MSHLATQYIAFGAMASSSNIDNFILFTCKVHFNVDVGVKHLVSCFMEADSFQTPLCTYVLIFNTIFYIHDTRLLYHIVRINMLAHVSELHMNNFLSEL